jgi:predicted nucleotidyltransferase
MTANDALTAPNALPEVIRRVLDEFTAAAESAFGADLRAVVLYGSAVENQLRATSDVNVLLVLTEFSAAKADRLRESLRTAQAAIRLTPMFLLEREIVSAAAAFSVKFADIRRRHRVLYGTDPFAELPIPREAQLNRLRQVLLNLVLRLREAYMIRSLREEQAALAVADAAGPLRSCGALMLELEGRAVGSGDDALRIVAASLDVPEWGDVLEDLAKVRECRALPPGAAPQSLLQTIALAERMLARVQTLP